MSTGDLLHVVLVLAAITLVLCATNQIATLIRHIIDHGVRTKNIRLNKLTRQIEINLRDTRESVRSSFELWWNQVGIVLANASNVDDFYPGDSNVMHLPMPATPGFEGVERETKLMIMREFAFTYACQLIAQPHQEKLMNDVKRLVSDEVGERMMREQLDHVDGTRNALARVGFDTDTLTKEFAPN